MRIDIPTPPVFLPLLQPCRYKGAHGGRGSGKSHFFASLLVEEHMTNTGMRSVCVRQVQRSLRDSSKRLIEDTIQALGIGSYFLVQEREIKCPGDGVILFSGLQDHTAESIKSLEGCSRAWCEEAHALSKRSWDLLRPTIRMPKSEIWASYNRTRRTDAVDQFFSVPSIDSICVQANWRDNPFFPEVMERDRQRDLIHEPESYDHVWEGGYRTALSGSYYFRQLAEARVQGRMCELQYDRLHPLKTYHDIGGAGANADAYVIWVVQFIGERIHVLDYYEARGQVLGAHVSWLREQGYERATVILPHDGLNANNITGKRYEDHWRDAGFSVPSPIPNQGRGADMQRIEAARRLFDKVYFDAERCDAGVAALEEYHERRDDARGIGLGPNHNWASHAADAFGLMAIDYRAPVTIRRRLDIPNYASA